MLLLCILLAVSSAGSKHLCCAGEAKLSHELGSWAGSDLGCTSKNRDLLLFRSVSLQRAPKSGYNHFSAKAWELPMHIQDTLSSGEGLGLW